MTWKHAWDYHPPADVSGDRGPAILGSIVLRDLLNAGSNFLPVAGREMGPQYANPKAYIRSMVQTAFGLTQNDYQPPLTPVDWDWLSAGIDAADAAFEMLKQLPRRPGDDVSVYDAWVGGTGQASSPIPQNAGDGTNAATGQSAAPPNTIL